MPCQSLAHDEYSYAGKDNPAQSYPPVRFVGKTDIVCALLANDLLMHFQEPEAFQAKAKYN